MMYSCVQTWGNRPLAKEKKKRVQGKQNLDFLFTSRFYSPRDSARDYHVPHFFSLEYAQSLLTSASPLFPGLVHFAQSLSNESVMYPIHVCSKLYTHFKCILEK